MATSWVDIANKALLRLGTDTITSLTQAHKNASLANQYIFDERDTLLQSFDYACSRARVDLAQLSATPVSQWTYQYELPNDCLKVWQTYPESDYSIEGGVLLTDEDSCSIRYAKQVTDPNKLPVLLRNAISAALASRLAIPLAKSQAEQNTLQNEAMYWSQRAAAEDAKYGQGVASGTTWWTTR